LKASHHIALTGASSGIGAALALHYAQPGLRLSLLARNTARLTCIAEKCHAAGADVYTRTGDVRNRHRLQEWLLASDEALPIDIVIANAGIGGSNVVTSGMPESAELASQIVETNVTGVINTVTPLIPRFVQRRQGQIVILSSLAGFLALPDAPAYCASKAALRIYGHGLRRLLAAYGVKVTVVCPGFVETPMSASLAGHRPFLWNSEKAAHRIARDIARGRSESVFPWPLAVAARLAAMLPSPVVDWALSADGRRKANRA
jgi:short-subunit dehydrogenase